MPREIIASDDEIRDAWNILPKHITKIPEKYRSPLLAKMCVALRVGLFDGAINYAWNTAIFSLRDKMMDFGLTVASQILEKDLTDGKINDITDSELLKFCLELSLINEAGYFSLSQCREIRNNYSAAHPVDGLNSIDDSDVINFISRCARYAFNKDNDPQGIDIKIFLKILKEGRLGEEQEKHWVDQISKTNDKQRDFILTTLHGIYCDKASNEETRLNCIGICTREPQNLTPKVLSNLINQHHDYVGKGEEDKQVASRGYFEKLGHLNLLSLREQHSIFSKALNRLKAVHEGMNNFYNEPPFAERLLELSQQTALPESIIHEFVETIITCAIGNEYGTSTVALPSYTKLIAGFKQLEIS